MTAAYLTVRKPLRKGGQWYATRRNPLTGCTVLHDAENVMDTVGPDTGAENVAEFIRTRSDPGSYHDLVDSDTGVHLIEYHHAAFHDGTGSNNWALSLSFACRTSDWRRMSDERRRGFLRQGALRFVAQQQWRKANRAPLTRLRYISKAESEAGQSGFCCHGWRDPARRTDPGTKAPNLFPFDEWLDACRLALAQFMPDHPDAADLPAVTGDAELNDYEHALLMETLQRVQSLTYPKPGKEHVAQHWMPQDSLRLVHLADEVVPRLEAQVAGLQAAVNTLAEAVAQGGGASADDLKAAVLEAIEEGVVKVEVAVSNRTGPPAS